MTTEDQQWDAFETGATAKLDQLTCDQLRALYSVGAQDAASALLIADAFADAFPDRAQRERVSQQAATRVAGLIRIQLAERCQGGLTAS